jgi:hypothetical protein
LKKERHHTPQGAFWGILDFLGQQKSTTIKANTAFQQRDMPFFLSKAIILLNHDSENTIMKTVEPFIIPVPFTLCWGLQ